MRVHTAVGARRSTPTGCWYRTTNTYSSTERGDRRVKIADIVIATDPETGRRSAASRRSTAGVKIMARPSVKVAYVNGDQTLIANLEVYKDRMTDAVADGMRKFGGRVEGESTRRCPSRPGNSGPGLQRGAAPGRRHLRAGGRLREVRRNLGEGKAYAVPVHERLGVRHPLGKRSSWRTP